mmetsp:Transcript_69989/g.121577  ORF Transcript_69989/g.121577 Transcript_69989/m.121577 type:complete len:141 (-) Transcript_69989:160-582(-)
MCGELCKSDLTRAHSGTASIQPYGACGTSICSGANSPCRGVACIGSHVSKAESSITSRDSRRRAKVESEGHAIAMDRTCKRPQLRELSFQNRNSASCATHWSPEGPAVRQSTVAKVDDSDAKSCRTCGSPDGPGQVAVAG